MSKDSETSELLEKRGCCVLLQGKMHLGKESACDHLGWERLQVKFQVHISLIQKQSKQTKTKQKSPHKQQQKFDEKFLYEEENQKELN